MSYPSKNFQRRQRTLACQRIGKLREELLARLVHKKYRPVLLDDYTLRNLGGGQVDIAYYDHKLNLIVLVEVKGKQGLSYQQRARLLKSAKIVGFMFHSCTVLKVAHFDGKKLTKFAIN